MSYFEELYNKGVINVADKSVIVCSMVRDCGNEIKHNIPVIEKVVSRFRDYRIAVFENNSLDNTKEVLGLWQERNKKVFVSLNDFDETKYTSLPRNPEYHYTFSIKVMTKLTDYRNLMLDLVEGLNFESDYVILVDLDVAKIDYNGVLSSFGTDLQWDAITANGYSMSSKLKRRYHDTFPLCEIGMQNQPFTCEKIENYREIFSHFSKGMPFFKVFSAFGGMCIYRSEAIKGLRYCLEENNFGGVQVKCEHFSLFRQMAELGFDKVYINPNMEILYQRINYKSLKRFFLHRKKFKNNG